MIKHVDPVEVRQVISEQTSERCRTILEGVVDGGTGKNAKVEGYRIGGKTGSSETGEEDHTIVSFLGFAPADDPQVVILLAYDNPKPTGPNSNYTSGGWYISGGNMAAPMAGELLGNILDYLGVEKSYSAQADTTVPNVTGLSLADATTKLKNANLSLRTVGDGETVTGQIPAANATIPGGSQVVLYMGAEMPTDQVQVPDVTGKTAEGRPPGPGRGGALPQGQRLHRLREQHRGLQPVRGGGHQRGSGHRGGGAFYRQLGRRRRLGLLADAGPGLPKSGGEYAA